MYQFFNTFQKKRSQLSAYFEARLPTSLWEGIDIYDWNIGIKNFDPLRPLANILNFLNSQLQSKDSNHVFLLLSLAFFMQMKTAGAESLDFADFRGNKFRLIYSDAVG